MKRVFILSFAILLPLFVFAQKLPSTEYEWNNYYQKTKQIFPDSSCQAMIDTLILSAENMKLDSLLFVAHKMELHYQCLKKNTEAVNLSFIKCKELCNQLPDKKVLLNIWSMLIEYNISINNSIGAMNELKELQKLAIELKNKVGMMESYYFTGSCYYTWSDYVTAFHHFKKAIDYGEQQKLPIHFGMYTTASACARMAKDETQSLIWQKKALEGYKINHKTEDGIIIILSGLLRNYIAFSDSLGKHSVDSLYKVLENEVQRIGKIGVFAQRRYNDAMLFYYMDYKKQPYKAINYLNSEKYLMANLNNARVYYTLKQYQKAADSYKTAYEMIRETQHKQISYTLDKYVERNDYDRMKSEYTQLELIKSNNELQLANEKAKLVKERNWIIGAFSTLIISIIISYLIKQIRTQHQTTKKLKADKEKAEKAEKMKSLFLQNMSHEIRTPLNAIVGFNDLLNGESSITIDETDRSEMLNIVKNNVELLQTLVSDVLDISKLESGTYTVRYSDIKVKQLCYSVAESVRDKAQTGVNIIVEENSNGLVINSDAQRLQQVLINFMTNACKYTSHGSITLGYHLNKEYVIFTVTDTGKGIAPQEAEEIFTRFKMLNKSVKGTGLGLHICRLIAELLKGKVYVDTTYCEGAKFVFELPIKG